MPSISLSNGRTSFFHAICACLTLLAVTDGRAQGPGDAPVRYTIAQTRDVRTGVKLPGTVESTVTSLVASEVQGVVASRRAGEGDIVRKGATLVQLKTNELELDLQGGRGELAEAHARLERAENAMNRARNLFDEDLVAAEGMDDAVADYRAWQGRVAQLNARIARIELDIERCTIRAPLGGVVVSERTEVGEWLNAGDPVVEIVAVDELRVRVEVTEQHFHQLREGGATTIRFGARPDLLVEGTIVALIPRADPRARTFPILVALANPGRELSVGMLAEVTLPLGRMQRSVLVPKDALIRQGEALFVWAIGDDGTASMGPVEVGDGYGDWVVAESGVTAGTKIVTRGNERLRPGQSVVGEALEYDLP